MRFSMRHVNWPKLWMSRLWRLWRLLAGWVATRRRKLRYGFLRWSYRLPFSKPGWLDREVELEIQLEERTGESLIACLGRRGATRLGKLPTAMRKPFWAVAITLVVYGIMAWILSYAVDAIGLDVVTWTEYISSLWQVQAAILGIALVVVALLVEKGARDSLSDDVYRYVVTDSGIRPAVAVGLTQIGLLTVLRLFVAFSDLATPIVTGSGLASSFTFLWYLILIARLYQRVVDYQSPGYRHRAIIEILRKRSMPAAAAAYAQLREQSRLSAFCMMHGIYMSALTDSRRDLQPILLSEYGIVGSIHLGRLAAFSRGLRQPVLPPNSSGSEVRAILLTAPGNRVASRNRVVARVHELDSSEEIQRLLLSAIDVADDTPEARNELVDAYGALKTEITQLIKERRTDDLDEALEAYVVAINSLLSSWHRVAGPESATAGSLAGFGRRPFSVIHQDVADLIRRAIDTEDPETIRPLLYLPIKLMRVAGQHVEAQLGREYAGLMVTAYWFCAQRSGSASRSVAVDLVGRYLSDYSEWFLERDIDRDTTDVSELPFLRASLLSIIRVYNALLKAAIDNGDVASFKTFGAFMDGLWHDLEFGRREMDIEMLQWQLREQEVSGATLTKEALSLQRLEAIHEVSTACADGKRVVWFGVGAWLLRELREGRLAWPDWGAVFSEAVSRHDDLGALARLYVQLRQEEPDALDWDGWVLNQLPSGQAHFIDTESWLRAYYCLAGLKVMPPSTTGENPIPAHRLWESDLQKLASECEWLTASEELHEIIHTDDGEASAVFRELHARASAQARREGMEALIGQPIDDRRVEQYCQEAEAYVAEHSLVATLLAHLEIGSVCTDGITSCQEVDAHDRRFLPKEGLVRDGDGLPTGWGEVSGTALVWEHDARLLKAFHESAETVTETTAEDILAAVRAARHELEVRGHTPDVALMATLPSVTLLTRQDANVSWDTSDARGRGTRRYCAIDGMGIVDVHQADPSLVLVADLNAFAAVVHTGEPDSVRWTSVHITAIAEAEAQDILRTCPGAAVSEGALPDDDPGLYLQRFVRVSSTCVAQVAILDPGAAIAIRVVAERVVTAVVDGDEEDASSLSPSG